MSKLQFLGNGSYGMVFKSYELDNENKEVVLKTMLLNMYNNKELEQLISFEREVAVLKRCDHPNILKYLDSFRNQSGQAIIVTEYANLGSLQDYFD